MPKPLKSISVEAKNSIGFLREVFRLYDQGHLFTIKRSGFDLANYPGLEETELITVDEQRGWGKFSHKPNNTSTPAQIVFSSGTEGLAKPFVLSGRNLAVVVERLNNVMALDNTVREYIGVPVTYSFGLGRARAVAAAGGAFYLPDSFDPVEIRDMLGEDEINAISAVPSLWRTILANPQIIGTAGEKVKWIEIGSQYMSLEEKEAMKQLFPNARIILHYGLTEASRSTFLDITSAKGEALGSVGQGTGDVELKIGPDSEICIRGGHVALGMLDTSGGIIPLTDPDGWLHTKDRGEIRDDLLWYMGRIDDQINVAGVKLAAETLEQEIGTLISAPRTFAITSIPDALRGEGVLLAVTSEAGDRLPLLEAAAQVALKRYGINQAGVLKIARVEELPTTGTGKVQRKVLRDEYLSESQEPVLEPGRDVITELSPGENKIVKTWQSVVGAIPIASGDTFYDVGGDSLSTIQIGIAMEGSFSRAAIRATLEGRTLSDIASVEEELEAEGGDTTPIRKLPRRTTESWAINATRGIMVLAVLGSHWSEGLFQRIGGAAIVEQLFAFFFRMGTPGFALVFGLGMGFFMLSGFDKNRISVRKRLRSALVLVFLGLLLLGGTNTLYYSMVDIPHPDPFNNVLTFYVLFLFTSMMWLEFFTRLRNPVPWIIATAILCWLLWWAARSNFGGPKLDSLLLEYPRLMIVASYSYFRLSAFVFIGMVIGYWLALHDDERRAAKVFMSGGIIGFAFSLVAGFEIYGASVIAARSAPFFNSTLGAIFYISIVLLFVGTAIRLISDWRRLPTLIQQILQILIVIGGLALPIYAFHGIVIPIKGILVLTGWPGALALLLPLSTFIVVISYAGWRLKRLYFV